MDTVWEGKATCVSSFHVGVGAARAMDFTGAAIGTSDHRVPYLPHSIASELRLLGAGFTTFGNCLRRRGARGIEYGLPGIPEPLEG